MSDPLSRPDPAMNDAIPPDLAAALGERYELRSLLGRGGMATVYLAFDRKHQRVVALKVLRPELAATLGSERFLAEIHIVAQLTHPNILPLHDSGEAGPFLYYVMPYISGGSLRQRLVERGPLGLPDALAIATPVADALSYAHGEGVLHRDIKPENILFSQGHAIVADFGIAKAVSSASGPSLTRTGLVLGTPGYMSPEQAAGFSDLDARTDVYSLAAVTYEMLVGEVPGRWPTEESVRTGRFLEAPEPHRPKLGVVGSRVESALVRALAVQPAQRTGSPADFIDALEGRAPRRQFRSEEAVEIVRRAAELEASTPTSAMTLGGVEALGAEVGIAPELVRSAAAELDVQRAAIPVASPREAPAIHPVAGGPIRILYERVVPGELPESEFVAVVDEIRMAAGNAGSVNQLGRSFTWHIGPGTSVRRDLEVSVTVRSGVTRIMVQESLNQLIGAVYGPSATAMGGAGFGVIGGILAGTMHNPLLVAVVAPVWALLTYGTGRTIYGRLSRKRARDLERLADRVAEVIRELAAPPRRLPGGR